MSAQRFLLLAGAVVTIGLCAARSIDVRAQSGSPGVALTGLVTSTEEGPMEGVIVSAKKLGAKLTTSVVSDAQGRYRFPASRLQPGQYVVSIRAVGYDLAGGKDVRVAGQQPTTHDLALKKTADLAAQLTNTEWLNSVPGTPQQKELLRGCAHCHTLERIARSKYTVEEFMPIVERMAKYPPLSFPLMPQFRIADRVGGGEDPIDVAIAARRRLSEYLTTTNLSTTPKWSYELRTQPRPKGQGTQVLYTEYDLPAPTRQPHDVIVDREGMVWYASFGEQILGRLDPRTGQVKEYTVPTLKPNSPKGILGLRFDRDENLWLGLQFQGGIAKFDKKTEKFQTWRLPPEYDGDWVQLNQISPQQSHVDGKVWFQDSGSYTVFRLDIASGKIEMFEPLKKPRPNLYDILPDSQNNSYSLIMGSNRIIKIDAKTGQFTTFETPTQNSGPRRGAMDPQDRLWFGENRSDKFGMLDTKTGEVKEWDPPTPGNWPYDVVADHNGEVWVGGEYNDRIIRANPSTGRMVEYLLPHQTNVRRVWVDNSTTPVTFWVGSNHSASIFKLEPLDPSSPLMSR